MTVRFQSGRLELSPDSTFEMRTERAVEFDGEVTGSVAVMKGRWRVEGTTFTLFVQEEDGQPDDEVFVGTIGSDGIQVEVEGIFWFVRE